MLYDLYHRSIVEAGCVPQGSQQELTIWIHSLVARTTTQLEFAYFYLKAFFKGGGGSTLRVQ